MDDLLQDFLVEAAEHIDAASMDLVRLERDPADAALVSSLFRHIHTIKGSSGFLSLPRVGRLTHGAETMIGKLRDGATATPTHVTLILAAVDRLSALMVDIGRAEMEPPGDDADILDQLAEATRELQAAPRPIEPPPDDCAPPPQMEEPPPAAPVAETPEATIATPHKGVETVRVAVGVLDRLMAIVSELVLTRNQLAELSDGLDDERLKSSVQNLSSVTGDLQDAVMQVRMQPVDRLFATLPRLVRDLSVELNKKIRIETIGGETELDRQVIELIRAPLTHIIRNAADHGVETPGERLAAGKPETGLVRVIAAYDAGQITLEIKDDGRGFNIERIREKALAKGLVAPDALAAMSETEIYQFVLLPGFSTAERVTKVSGRGVGMDVVKENIQSIGGTVSLNSRAGKGSTVTLRIPLTLAIAPALIVEYGGHRFAAPQMAVVEVVGVGDGYDSEVQHLHGAPILRLRGEALPLAHLGVALDLAPPEAAMGALQGFCVVLRVGGVRFGLFVDAIADVQEVVIEPLVGVLARIRVFSGQTILGGGDVVLILDPAALMQRAGLENFVNARAMQAAPEYFTPEREKTRIVLLRAGDGAMKALPLSLIMRIEEVAASSLAPAGDFHVLQHEGRLLPVMRAAPDMRVNAAGEGASVVYPLLILAGAGQALGLIVDEIVDVAEHQLVLHNAAASPRVIGAFSFDGDVVELLDITYFFNALNPELLARGVDRRKRVLLVDDRLFFRDMLGPVLSASNYEVTSAASAREALGFLEKGLKVDAVVTDIDMPEMDGYAFARRLRERPDGAALPIVALAPQATEAARDAARNSGVDAVVGKFDRAGLVEIVDKLLRVAGASPQDIERRLIAELAA
jgi:two-component system, chemotaxis family, sensor kinase CheA